jgi:hypothetical protein
MLLGLVAWPDVEQTEGERFLDLRLATVNRDQVVTDAGRMVYASVTVPASTLLRRTEPSSRTSSPATAAPR